LNIFILARCQMVGGSKVRRIKHVFTTETWNEPEGKEPQKHRGTQGDGYRVENMHANAQPHTHTHTHKHTTTHTHKHTTTQTQNHTHTQTHNHTLTHTHTHTHTVL